MGSGSARAPNFGCVRGTKPSFFTFARENSGVQPLMMVRGGGDGGFTATTIVLSVQSPR